MGCATTGGRSSIGRADACGLLDSLYETSGFARGVTLAGKATVDANQQRLHGKFRLVAAGNGDVTFEFTSTLLFGTQREDFILSLMADTLRVLDRERGALYVGSDAEDFIQQSLEMEFGVQRALHLTLGGHPPCVEIEAPTERRGTDGSIELQGRLDGERWRLRFGAGRGHIEEAQWPVRLGRGRRDRFVVTYRWMTAGQEPARLDEIEMELDGREWRCRLVSVTN